MTHLIKLDECIEVQRPLHEVFAYISEFSRVEEWDPAVARGLRLTDGALGVGSQFRVDMKAGFSLLYTVPARRQKKKARESRLPGPSYRAACKCVLRIYP